MLVMELNELCPSLMDKFIAQGELPNFAKLQVDSFAIETETDATGEDLNPWVQWVDVHTGLNWEEHEVKQLSKLENFNHEFIWDTLSRKYGISNWICGSMNAKYSQNFKGRFLPDPWCTNIQPSHKDSMEVYYNYVSNSVQNHSKEAATSSLEFVKVLLKQGISIKTFFGVVKQLFNEKIRNKDAWKRAMWLDRIQLEVFKHYYKNEKPQFATFFSNAVAHFQHHYWNDYNPAVFSLNDSEINKSTQNAILDAYRNTDFLVGELRELVGEDTAIIFATGLSQSPYIKNTRHYYNLNSKDLLYSFFGVSEEAKYSPIMAEQFFLKFPTEKMANETLEHLCRFKMDSSEYFHVGSDQLFLVSSDDKTLQVQCRVTKVTKDKAEFFDSEAQDKKYKFQDYFYRMNEVKTGMHNPVGLYWFKGKNKDHIKSAERVKPSSIHRDILDYFVEP